MAANRALAELDQAARDDVCTFDGDSDGYGAIKAAEIIERPLHDSLAAMHIHGIVDRNTHSIGRLGFHDRRDDRGLVTMIDCSAGQAPRGIKKVSGAGHTAEPLLDGLEL